MFPFLVVGDAPGSCIRARDMTETMGRKGEDVLRGMSLTARRYGDFRRFLTTSDE